MKFAPFFLLAAVWLTITLLINPRGDFPLNDDWMYGWSVLALLKYGRLELTSWNLAPGFTQAFWGLLFCLPAGFSFDALRLSSQAAGLIGIFLSYCLARECGSGRRLATLGAMTLAVNPLYVNLSNTFMSDVPFLVFALLATVFFVRAIKSDRRSDFVLGNLFALCAIVNRQFGIALSLACSAALVFRDGLTARTVKRALVPPAAGLVVIGVYELWLRSQAATHFAYEVERLYLKSLLARGPLGLVGNAVGNLVSIFVYVGLFLAPYLVAILPAWWAGLDRGRRIFCAALAAEAAGLVGLVLYMKQLMMPLADNILCAEGIGPFLLRGAKTPLASRFFLDPRLSWLIVTVFGVAAGSVLFAILVSILLNLVYQPRKDEEYRRGNWLAVYLLTLCGLYVAFIGATGLFDRYLIFLLPFLIALCADRTRQPHPIAAGRARQAGAAAASAVLIVLLGIFSAASMHDYFSWHRIQWRALQHLTAELHVSPLEVDGGREFNGWISTQPEYRDKPPADMMTMGHGDEFAVSLAPLPGYAPVQAFPFHRWMPFGRDCLYLLKKLPAQ